MNSIKKFVSYLLKDYFSDQDKKELIEILTLSLEEKVEDLIESGTPKEEAIKLSLQEFGSAEDILEAFPDKTKNRKRLLHTRKSQLLFSVLAYLLICGIAIFVNLTFLDFFGGILWLFVIVIGVLFWPLVMLYLFLTSKE